MSDTAPGSLSDQEVSGHTLPRRWTRPLIVGEPGPCGCGCALTPETSIGFAVTEWASEVLHFPPDPWQRWLLIHGLEVLPDGRPRFRTLLVEVARQNGKTTLLVILALWWQFVVEVDLVLGTSTKLDYAKESWHKSIKIAESALALGRQRARRWTRDANGEQESWSVSGSRYKIAPSNAEGGRSLTVHRLILDELRQHYDYSAWAASVNAGNAVRNFQVWGITNAGTDRSVVLNELHAACETFLTWADDVGHEQVAALRSEAPGDWRTGMFSWSCTPEMDPLDPAHLAIANPNLGRRLELDTLLGAARTAVAAGGEALATYKTEAMCVRVPSMNLAIDLGAWGRTAVAGTLEGYRGRLAACVDVAPDGRHISLVVAAVLEDGRVRLEVVQTWDSLAEARRELPAWVARVKPYVFGWFPASGAAALSVELADRAKQGKARVGWPPAGVRLEAIRAEATAVCMGFGALVAELQTVHDPSEGQMVLTLHMGNVEKSPRPNNMWVFDAAEGKHITAAYAAAGAAHLARTIPVPRRGAGLHLAR